MARKCILKNKKKKEIVTNKDLLKKIYLEDGVINGAKKIGIGINTMRRWLDEHKIKRFGKLKYIARKKNPNMLYFQDRTTSGYKWVNQGGWRDRKSVV